MNTADEALLERVKKACGQAEPNHKRFSNRAAHFYSLWRSYQDFKTAYTDTRTDRGRDHIFNDGQQTFGAQMFIPMAFAAVETTLPKLLAQRPTMKAKPRDPASEPNTQNIEFLVNAQQEQMRYELALQEIGKDGLIYGLSWQKTMWKTEYRRRTRLVPSEGPTTMNSSGFTQVSDFQKIYDDPVAVSVDPLDLLFDPYASSGEDAEFLIHRSWRPSSYVKKRIELGLWRNLDDPAILQSLDSTEKWSEVWGDRQTAAGYGAVQKRGDRKVHEVLECHFGGEEVVVVLDRQVVVASGENPMWHAQYPFQHYRPMHDTHRIPGIGVVEAVEELNEEMNTLRRQRRDNASLVLQAVFAYADGVVDQDDIRFVPGGAIPVGGGVQPSEALQRIPVGDIPYSGYQEEDRLRADYDRALGLSDPTQGVPVGGTATESQLVFQATTDRIKNMITRLELEVINPGTEQIGMLDQQHILSRDVRMPIGPSDPEQITVGAVPQPYQEPEARWAWKKLTPAELAGTFAWYADGTTTPENVPQMRSDGQMLQQFAQDNPNIDQRKVTPRILALLGEKNPDQLLATPPKTVPLETINAIRDSLVQSGMPEQAADAAIAQALQQTGATGGGGPASGPPAPVGGGSDTTGGPPPPDGGNGP